MMYFGLFSQRYRAQSNVAWFSEGVKRYFILISSFSNQELLALLRLCLPSEHDDERVGYSSAGLKFALPVQAASLQTAAAAAAAMGTAIRDSRTLLPR